MSTHHALAAEITREEAAALATIAQGLDARPPAPAPSDHVAWQDRLLETIERIGCVQLDTISVISRSHETVLWSRLGPYDPADLAALLYPRGDVVEYWVHAAAIAPVSWFPLFRPVMEQYRARTGQPGAWATERADLVERVLSIVAEQGPVPSRAFERPRGDKPAPWAWWGGKPERQALEHLWSTGDIVVQRRESNFQRVWDLTERVISPEVLAIRLAPEDVQHTLAGRALAALGVATPHWLADYFRAYRPHVPLPRARHELAALEAAGEAVPVTITGLDGRFWLHAPLLDRLDDLRAGDGPTLTTLLSPFDNLVWNRARTETLWNFFYRIETYTVAERRQYGYYSLPILHRGRLVGRLDPSLDRKAGILTVKTLHIEPGVRPTIALGEAIGGAFADLARFLGAGNGIRLPEGDGPVIEGIMRKTAR
jgi:uncharacterized protein YcaQ